MINLEFLPSRQLAFYSVRLYLTRSFAVLIGLVLVLMALDLLGDRVGFAGHAEQVDGDQAQRVAVAAEVLQGREQRLEAGERVGRRAGQGVLVAERHDAPGQFITGR